MLGKIHKSLLAISLLSLAVIISPVYAQKKDNKIKTMKDTAKTNQSIKETPKKTETIQPKPMVNIAIKTYTPSTLETQVLAEINLLRSNPRKYAEFLAEWERNFVGSELRLPGQTPLVTLEGAAAVKEAIDYLKKLPLLPNLTFSNGLGLAAQDHLKDMQKNNLRGHQGSDKSYPDARVERYGMLNGGVNEIIKYNAMTAREIVIGTIIDDGNPTRGHRLAILNSNHTLIGIANGSNDKFKSLCIVVLANNYLENR
jgi:uncharacterized protein YkwD